eukprot:3535297-Rhodomonas_salina.1
MLPRYQDHVTTYRFLHVHPLASVHAWFGHRPWECAGLGSMMSGLEIRALGTVRAHKTGNHRKMCWKKGLLVSDSAMCACVVCDGDAGCRAA